MMELINACASDVGIYDSGEFDGVVDGSGESAIRIDGFGESASGLKQFYMSMQPDLFIWVNLITSSIDFIIRFTNAWYFHFT